jgi:hypothetical protein
VAIPSISYGILKIVKLGIKRLKAKLWLKLWLKIPKRILLTRFNINCVYVNTSNFIPGCVDAVSSGLLPDGYAVAYGFTPGCA